MEYSEFINLICKELNIRTMELKVKYQYGASKFSIMPCIYREEEVYGLAIYNKYVDRIIIPIQMINSFIIKNDMIIINEGVAIKND